MQGGNRVRLLLPSLRKLLGNGEYENHASKKARFFAPRNPAAAESETRNVNVRPGCSRPLTQVAFNRATPLLPSTCPIAD